MMVRFLIIGGFLIVAAWHQRSSDAKGLAEAFALLRAQFDGDVVCEPRHASWFTDAAEALLVAHRIARVAADPAPVGVEGGAQLLLAFLG